jgi:protein-L-isoaspartate O-methyltransferase
MREQENRDRQREELEHDNSIVNYLILRIEQGSATGFEKALVVRSLRDQFYNYYKRLKDYNKVEYPSLNPNWDKNSDWAKETSNRINRLNKLNIFNDSQLKTAIEQDYQYIIDHLEQDNNPVAREIKKLEREYRMQQKGDIHFTPEQLVNTILEYADISEGEKVLEPSAGIGSIVDRVKEITNNIDVVEWNYSFNNLLKLKGYNVIGSDFMQLNNHNVYDKIVMNPPFSKECEHIKQAYKMLKNNGRIVAITSPHYTFANDKESKEFREWLNNLDYEIIDVDKNIQFDKTNVATKILIINKDEASYNVAM